MYFDTHWLKGHMKRSTGLMLHSYNSVGLTYYSPWILPFQSLHYPKCNLATKWHQFIRLHAASSGATNGFIVFWGFFLFFFQFPFNLYQTPYPVEYKLTIKQCNACFQLRGLLTILRACPDQGTFPGRDSQSCCWTGLYKDKKGKNKRGPFRSSGLC